MGHLPDAPATAAGNTSGTFLNPGGEVRDGRHVETFQLSMQAAEVYESQFVPAIFAEWAPHLVDVGGVRPGQAVLDVACGTGVVAREAAGRLAGRGKVVGVDSNEAMLAVARRIRPEIVWKQGDAADLPFDAGAFDVVLCQAALMFFPDRAGALREMARVTTDGGPIAVQVWDQLAAQEGYGPLTDVLVRHAGPEAVDLESSYWALGDLELLTSLFEAAGLLEVAASSRVGTVRTPTPDDLVRTEIEATPLAGRLGEEAYRSILADAREALRPFTTGDGRLELPIRGHLVTARR
jgi:ubiquinone/menaquinone biosynthesis C-methylase UbiE